MKLYIMGGGAKIVELAGDYDRDNVTFNHDIRANAKGYEYFCYMKLRRMAKQAGSR
jgi:plasmid segregation protein ParM